MLAIKYTRITLKAVKTLNISQYNYIIVNVHQTGEQAPRRSPDTGHEPPPPGADAGYQKKSSGFTALNRNIFLKNSIVPNL